MSPTGEDPNVRHRSCGAVRQVCIQGQIDARPPLLGSHWPLFPAKEFGEQILFARVSASGIERIPIKGDPAGQVKWFLVSWRRLLNMGFPSAACIGEINGPNKLLPIGKKANPTL